MKRKNYGFPAIGYGREYSGKPINGDKTAQDGMEQPPISTPGSAASAKDRTARCMS
jgi:glucose/arabinose dehydrogenase